MKKQVVIIGVGEMGGVFARGFLRQGRPLYSVIRDMNLAEEANLIPDPEGVLLAVGEKDLHEVLEKMPEAWRSRLILLQNELLPSDWRKHGLVDPTVISVWFEKKPGQDFKVIIPSPVYGPLSGLVSDALGAIGIPCKILASPEELLFELVVKNVYILTTNIAGLVCGGNVQLLWEKNRELADQVARDVIAVQETLTGEKFDAEKLIAAMKTAFDGDPEHRCLGRTAADRLERALNMADQYGVDAPKLREIAGKI